jgi:hypothetical protein
MDQFSYLSVLLSIIVGLAITQILKGYRGILLARTQVRMYWPTLVWSTSLLLMNVQSWWAMFGLRDVEVWTFGVFAVVLFQTIVQYMLAALVFPDFHGGERVDLRGHYWAHARWFFALTILVLLTSLAKDYVLSGHLTDRLNVIFHVGFITLGVIALATRREWFHKFLAVATAVLFCVYVVLLFARLPHVDQ